MSMDIFSSARIMFLRVDVPFFIQLHLCILLKLGRAHEIQAPWSQITLQSRVPAKLGSGSLRFSCNFILSIFIFSNKNRN